jgi:hypothetical protein
LPQDWDASELAEAWSKAVMQQAIEANLSTSPPPTTLAGMRADLLMHVCKKLERLVTERETEVILRLSPSGARAVHRQMKANYEDVLYDFILKWALRDAALDGIGKFEGVRGDRVVFSTKDSFDAATTELGRAGWKFTRKRDDLNKPYLLFVETKANIAKYFGSS